MNFCIKEAIQVLERTPQALEHFLSGLSEGWLNENEGEGTWTVSEVIQHLIEAEKHNWIPRLQFILQQGEDKPFPPFDRYAHLKSPYSSTKERLLYFNRIRTQNLNQLQSLIQSEKHLEWGGVHPTFGVVKVRELLATWVVHDLTHMAQIVRVMAARYSEDVGPWKEYLGILQKE